MIQSLPLPNRGIICHRGAQDCAPENTLKAVEAAYQKGANWVEVDIQLTLDHQWVVFHDDTLLRTCGKPGYLSEYTLKELRTFPIFEHYQIPTLSEILSCVWQYRGVINLEVKIDPIVENWLPIYLQKTRELLEYWPIHHFKPLISSFNHELLKNIFTQFPGQPLGFLMDTIDLSVINSCARHADSMSINFNENQVTPEVLHLLKTHHLSSYCYTVNDPKRIKALLEQGITGIFTDIPCTFFNSSY